MTATQKRMNVGRDSFREDKEEAEAASMDLELFFSLASDDSHCDHCSVHYHYEALSIILLSFLLRMPYLRAVNADREDNSQFRSILFHGSAI